MIENERRILSYARRKGAICKPELCRSSEVNCGWATASKLIDRLVKEELFEVAGTDGISRRYGKNAIAYKLSEKQHLTVAIDVEKTVTRTGIVALSGRILAETTRPTPVKFDYDVLRDFLVEILAGIFDGSDHRRSDFAGIGIGIPVTVELLRHGGEVCAELGRELAARTGCDCRVANNIAVLGEYFRCTSGLTDFALVGHRTGIGGAVVTDNRLQRGRGGAGEFGRFKLADGQTLEQAASFPALARRYREKTGRELDSMSALFDRIAAGEAEAAELVRELAAALHQLFAALDCTLNPPMVVIAADFGPHGRMLEKWIGELEPSIGYQIIYRSTGVEDHLLAGAMQIQNRYFL
ncbi:MAG: ROK family protein [Victivallaceae bacterium]